MTSWSGSGIAEEQDVGDQTGVHRDCLDILEMEFASMSGVETVCDWESPPGVGGEAAVSRWREKGLQALCPPVFSPTLLASSRTSDLAISPPSLCPACLIPFALSNLFPLF